MTSFVIAPIAGKAAKSLLRNNAPCGENGKPALGCVLKERKPQSLPDHIKDALPSIAIGTAMTAAVALAGIPLMSAAAVGIASAGTAILDTALEAALAWKSLKDKDNKEGVKPKKKHKGKARDDTKSHIPATETPAPPEDKDKIEESRRELSEAQKELGVLRQRVTEAENTAKTMQEAASALQGESSWGVRFAFSRGVSRLQDATEEQREALKTAREEAEKAQYQAQQERENLQKTLDQMKETNPEAFNKVLEEMTKQEKEDITKTIQDSTDDLDSENTTTIRGKTYEAYQLVYVKELITAQPEAWNALSPDNMEKMIRVINKCDERDRAKIFNNLTEWMEKNSDKIDDILSPNRIAELYLPPSNSADQSVGQNINALDLTAKGSMERMIKAISNNPSDCDPVGTPFMYAGRLRYTVYDYEININNAEAERHFDNFIEHCRNQLTSDKSNKVDKYKIKTALRFFMHAHNLSTYERDNLQSMFSNNLNIKFAQKVAAEFPDLQNYPRDHAVDSAREEHGITFAQQISLMLKVADSDTVRDRLGMKNSSAETVFDCLLTSLTQAVRGYNDITQHGIMRLQPSLTAAYRRAGISAENIPSFDSQDPAFLNGMVRNDAVDDDGNIKLSQSDSDTLRYRYELDEDHKLSITSVSDNEYSYEGTFTHRDLLDKGSCGHGAYNIIATGLNTEVKSRPIPNLTSEQVTAEVRVGLRQILQNIEQAPDDIKTRILNHSPDPVYVYDEGKGVYALRNAFCEIIKPYLEKKILNGMFAQWGHLDNLSTGEQESFKNFVTARKTAIQNFLNEENLIPILETCEGKNNPSKPNNNINNGAVHMDSFVTWYINARKGMGQPIA